MKKIAPVSYLKLAMLFLGSCLFITCSKEPTTKISDNGGTPTNQIVIPKIIPKGNEKYLTNPSDSVYDQGSIQTFQLLIKPEDLLKLDNDPTREEYVEAALVYKGDTVSPIGVRYKGSIGNYAGCVSGTDWTRPSGFKTCVKLSMQLKLNWNDRKEKFYGLNKLQFHSQNYDKSQLRERLGYWLFQQMGVKAPRAVHTRVFINGIFYGLYGLIEEIDNPFAELNFKNGKGNILKEVWPLKPDGTRETDQAFIAALRTNEEKADVNLMSEFAAALEKAPESEVKNVIIKYMDINSIMSYIVVDRGIRHDDGPFHWYCNGNTPCYNHNYYWFEDQKNRKIHLIPWDLDGAFEHIIRNGNPITPISDKWGKISNNCQPFFPPNSFIKQWSASCDKLTNGWVKFENEFKTLKEKFQTQILTDEKTINQLNFWANQIRPVIQEADNYYNGGVTYEPNKKATPLATWQSSVNDLKNQVIISRILADY